MLSFFKKAVPAKPQAITQFVAIPAASYDALSEKEREVWLEEMTADGWSYYHRGQGLIIEARKGAPVSIGDSLFGVDGVVEMSRGQVHRLIDESSMETTQAPVLTDQELELRELFEEFASENNLHGGPASDLLVSFRRSAAAGTLIQMSDVDAKLKNYFGERLRDLVEFQNQQALRFQAQAA